MSQNTRLILAFAISMIIISIWQEQFVKPMVDNNNAAAPAGMTPYKEDTPEDQIKDREEVIAAGIKDGTRLPFNNSAIEGTVNLIGARIDDVTLLRYKKTIEDKSPNIILYSPSGTQSVYFAEFGWVSNDNVHLPDNKTKWSVGDGKFLDDGRVLLYWVNNQNIRFEIIFELDKDYMFNVTQRIINKSSKGIKLRNYSLISRTHDVEEDSNMIVHEGAIGVFNDKLEEVSFDKIENDKFSTTKGWFGFSDKYWLSVIVPQMKFSTNFSQFISNKQERFQADSIGNDIVVSAGNVDSQSNLLFVGSKQLELLDGYQSKYNIPLFDRSVDFGVLYFITKPILLMLQWIYNYIGNFGVAILGLTLFIKILLFPVAHKGFKGMNRLKELQPKMAQLKEKFKDDSAGFQQELMKLYKKEKVNPVAGCLPMILQIPVFFALYKVLYVSIEMRHAEFFGWVHDLSARDTTSLFNLFGLIPWDPPSMLMVGVFPILMAITMFLQQRMNPAPTDPVQAKVMKFLPVIFLVMFSSFPVGLLVYWTWSNILSIAQQSLIKKI